MSDSDGLSEEVTYHSAAAAADETYDPETGTYALTVGDGDGAWWFNDEDNSHWIMWVF